MGQREARTWREPPTTFREGKQAIASLQSFATGLLFSSKIPASRWQVYAGGLCSSELQTHHRGTFTSQVVMCAEISCHVIFNACHSRNETRRMRRMGTERKRHDAAHGIQGLQTSAVQRGAVLERLQGLAVQQWTFSST